MNDLDTISLAAACILDCADEAGPHWHVLADWLNSVAVRAEAGEVGVDHDYAVTLARALFAEETA